MEKRVQHVAADTLIENEITNGLYSLPENYDSLKQSVIEMGILEPIIVNGNKVVSGNLRLNIAKELGIEKVPVIDTSVSEDEFKLVSISHNQQRKKKQSEILKEYEMLKEMYHIRQGVRTDLNPDLKKKKEELDKIIGGKTKVNTLTKVKALGIELYGEDSEEYRDMWDRIDEREVSISKQLKQLEKKKKSKVNENVIPATHSIIADNVRVYNKSCTSMSEIGDNEISCIVTSPEYFGMIDYGTGENQIGKERRINDYISRTIECMNECRRVLKEDGSLWVNINEPVVNKSYECISHQFALAMKQEGWYLRDEWIWLKNNSQYTFGDRSVRSHEYIFHFTKSENYYYDSNWIKEIEDPANAVSLGSDKELPKLLSGMDFRDGVVRTNGNNMSGLRKACEEKGFYLTHQAGFPLTIPLICILTSTKQGDTVLDCFSGTGTTAEAALKVGRKYIGYEIKSEFVVATEVRLDEYLKSKENQQVLQIETLLRAA